MNPCCFPHGKTKALTLSYDDGVEQDQKLIEILDRHGIRATFNLNSGCFSPEGTVFPEGQIHRRMTRSQVLKTYNPSVHEIAVHGYTHAHPTSLSSDALIEEFSKDRKELEQLFGVTVRGSAYAYGDYNDEVVSVLKELGIVYARTVNASHTFDIPQDFLRLQPTCHHDDPKLFELLEAFLSSRDSAPQVFYLWGHSYEFEDHNNWDRIEKFCQLASGHDDIWYCTNIALYDAVQGSVQP